MTIKRITIEEITPARNPLADAARANALAEAAAPKIEREKSKALADKIIDAGFKALAKERHDAGGSAKDMKRLLNARQKLKDAKDGW